MKTYTVNVDHLCRMTYRIEAEDNVDAMEAARKLAQTDLTRNADRHEYTLTPVHVLDEGEHYPKGALAVSPVFDAKTVMAFAVAADDAYDGYSAALHEHMDKVYEEGRL